MIPLSERINLELRHRNPIEVTELILDTSKSDKIEGLTDEYVNLKELSLVNVGLKSLKGFPTLPKLTKLDLSDNRISSDLDCLKTCPNLNQLLLTSNRIKTIDDLKPLCHLNALEVLDLCNCDVTKTENYLVNVFQLLPQLVYLDGFDRNEEDDSDSDEYEESEFDEHNDDFHPTNAKFGYASGKNGKYRPPITEYQEDCEDVQEDGFEIYDTYNSHYYEEYSENDEDDANSSEVERFLPPTNGSKFVPSPITITHSVLRNNRKRSFSSEDDYEAASKIFLQDGLGFIPSHE